MREQVRKPCTIFVICLFKLNWFVMFYEKIQSSRYFYNFWIRLKLIDVLNIWNSILKILLFNLCCLDILTRCFTEVKYKIDCHDGSYQLKCLQELTKSLNVILNAKYNEIVVSMIGKGCVSVTFMISDRLIPVLRSLYMNDNLHKTLQKMSSLKHSILKVSIEDEIIYTSSMYYYSFVLLW